ncbi:MAG: nitronate monooxygenase, partial [Phycisphaerae bacterium]
CICSALFATIGLAQTKNTPEGRQEEPSLVTAGNDVTDLARLFPAGQNSYTAADVVHYLIS